MLNEFIPVSQNRRNFSGRKKNMENQKIEQLEISKAKLNLIKENLDKGICFA
jgi:DNA-binding Xre family transcriptional regulator